jgi:hypothetical protein
MYAITRTQSQVVQAGVPLVPQAELLVEDAAATTLQSLRVLEGATSDVFPGAAECTYVMQQGDTLELVAEALQTTTTAILEVNPRITQQLVKPGLSLQLPLEVTCPSKCNLGILVSH